jgi:hypothetical protein
MIEYETPSLLKRAVLEVNKVPDLPLHIWLGQTLL